MGSIVKKQVFMPLLQQLPLRYRKLRPVQLLLGINFFALICFDDSISHLGKDQLNGSDSVIITGMM